MDDYFSVRWENGIVRMLDQRLLPHQVIYREFITSEEVATAIKEMIIRGAPAIGIAAGFGLALTAYHSKRETSRGLIKELEDAAGLLLSSRPTAINICAAIDRIMGLIRDRDETASWQLKQVVISEAQKIADEDIQMNKKIGMNGQAFIPDPANVIHHCNTGALATGGYGTALGIIRAAHESGKRVHVYVDETRPRLQGARLTSWELKQLGIPHTIIVDGASGFLMRRAKIDACLVGCDRIASNGDVANKIGTYNLALAAYTHEVPFYCVGPTSTIDLSIESGDSVPIEERESREITHIGNEQVTPDKVDIFNPAFDITPAKFITAIITNAGVALPPYKEALYSLLKG